jgi:hypothetical protein
MRVLATDFGFRRHGCDTDGFWELLGRHGFAFETVGLVGNAADMQRRAGQVTAKANQKVLIRKVWRLPRSATRTTTATASATTATTTETTKSTNDGFAKGLLAKPLL